MTNRILLLEDAPAVNSFLSGNLAPLGELIRARSMIEAIVQAERFRPDVIVSDARVDDLEPEAIIRELRRECVGIPIVIMSAEDFPVTVMRMVRAGAYEVLPRAISGEQIQKAIVTALDISTRDDPDAVSARQPGEHVPPGHVPIPLHATLDEAVDQFTAAKLEMTGGSVPKAARELGLSPSTLYRWLDKRRKS